MRRTFRFLAIGLFLCSCLGCPAASPAAPDETTAYLNGRFYTVNPEQPWAEAVVVRDGEIVMVGTVEDVKSRLGPGTKILDLKGAFVLPGFHDTHVHALESGSENTHFTLPSEVESLQDYESIVVAAGVEVESEWLVGFGHSLDTALDSEVSPRELLDDWVPDRPVIIMEQTSHSMWVNSRALELAGLRKTSGDPPGGVLLRDSTGELTGLLLDNAGNMVMDLALKGTPERLERDYRTLAATTLPRFAELGITSFCEARVYWQRGHLEVWKRLESQQKLTARVNLGLWAYPALDDSEQLDKLVSFYDNNDRRLLKVNQIKLYSDGIVHNTTAAMKEPYRSDLFGGSNYRGLNYFAPERLQTYLKRLEPVGFDFHIHAIGDRAVTESLSAIEQATSGSGRHRLTHLEFVDPKDYPRFKQLNVTADCQVAGDFTEPDQWAHNDSLVGAGRTVIPLKDLQAAGARITLSSDWNVSDLNPLVGLQNAVTRVPQELTLEQAIRSYTMHSAYLMGQEDQTGSLKVGKRADFVVLEHDLFEIPAEGIANTQVLMTVFDGEIIFDSM